MNILGKCLARTVSFTERTGFVILRLVYGLDITNVVVNTAWVSGRTVLVKQDLEYAYTAGGAREMMVGVQNEATTKGLKTFRRITPNEGYDTSVEMPYQQIRLTCFFNAAGLVSFVQPIFNLAGALNSSEWIVFGTTFAVNQLMYRGSTIGLYRDTPGADRIYRCDLDWLGHPFTWQRILKYSTYEKGGIKVDIKDSTGATIGQRVVMTFINKTDVATVYQYRKEHDFASLLSGIIVT